MNRTGTKSSLHELESGFDHELALLRAGQRRIIKMEFSHPSRVALAESLGYVCLPATGHYGIGSESPDIVYGTGECTTVFVGTADDARYALHLEQQERGPDPDERLQAMRELGVLLGYPACCTEAYEKQRTQDESASFARLLGGADRVEGHYANNLFVLDHQVISHFPCDLKCPVSQEVGLHALRLYRKDAPVAADALIELLKSPVQVWDRFRIRVNHPSRGILFANNISKEPRVHAHPTLTKFLDRLPLLPDGGTWVHWIP